MTRELRQEPGVSYIKHGFCARAFARSGTSEFRVSQNEACVTNASIRPGEGCTVANAAEAIVLLTRRSSLPFHEDLVGDLGHDHWRGARHCHHATLLAEASRGLSQNGR